MRKQKFKVCECCGKELPANRDYFKRIRNKETDKEELASICRECETALEYQKHWDGDKLRCLVCGESKDPSEFGYCSSYAVRGHKDGRCHKCKLELNKQARKNYSDELKLHKVLQARVLNASTRAKQKNIPCTITLDFIKLLWDKLEGLCAISKIPMTYELDSGRIFTNISIDQINLGLGYTEDNVQLVCMAVNLLKSDWDINTVLYICKSIVNNYNI